MAAHFRGSFAPFSAGFPRRRQAVWWLSSGSREGYPMAGLRFGARVLRVAGSRAIPRQLPRRGRAPRFGETVRVLPSWQSLRLSGCGGNLHPFGVCRCSPSHWRGAIGPKQMPGICRGKRRRQPAAITWQSGGPNRVPCREPYR